MNQTRLSQAAQRTYRAAYPQTATVGSRGFAAWMTANRVARRDLASSLGCTSASVAAWVSGRRVPTIELARRIEALTGIAIAAWVDVGVSEAPLLAPEDDP